MMPTKQPKQPKQLNTYIKHSSSTIQMAVIIAAGTFLGDYLDKSTESPSKIYTIIFSLSSIFLALYYVFKKTRKNNEKK